MLWLGNTKITFLVTKDLLTKGLNLVPEAETLKTGFLTLRAISAFVIQNQQPDFAPSNDLRAASVSALSV